MGSLLSGTENGWAPDSFGKERSYKYIRIESCQIRNFNFHSHVSKSEVNTYSNGQHSCPFLYSKNGGYTKQNFSYLEQRNMVVFIDQGGQDYCRVSPRSTKQRSRFPVQSCKGFKRVEVNVTNISINLPSMGKTRHKPICITSVSPGNKLHVMETGSFQHRQRCVSDLLDAPEREHFPHFSLIGQVLNKVQSEQTTLILITPAWQAQSWFPKLLQKSVRTPLLLPKNPELLLGPSKETHPLVERGNLQLLAWTISAISYTQKQFQKNLLLLSQMQGRQVQTLITNWPGVSGVVGVLKDKLIPLKPL